MSRKKLTKILRESEAKFHDHKGVIVYDPEKQENIFEFNSASYFTPASNTKILTLLTSLHLLPDSVPSIRYHHSRDSLIFWGTGDPSFLYPEVHQSGRTYDFLKNAKVPLYFSNTNFQSSHFGNGWAWDDYNSSYSAERSPLPIFGNCLYVYPGRRQVLVWPSYFKDKISTGTAESRASITRDPFSNQITYHPGPIFKREWIIPFRIDQGLIVTLLSDTLGKLVAPVTRQMPSTAKTLYSVHVDSLYRVMMQDSDNLIAEHLLMMCGGMLSDSLQPEIAIKWMQQHELANSPDPIVWKDGSGLSRYNLITPRSIVDIWKKIYVRIPRARLFPLLATGGRPGTLKNWYKAEPPYVFGKTGTLSNNHALSGFLVTKSGKTLIFCFMNANFTAPMNDIRENMQKILDIFYEKY